MRKRPPSPATPSPPVALGFAAWVGGRLGPHGPSGHFYPQTLILSAGPRSLYARLLRRPAPLARSPASRRGWNVLSSSRGRFLSAMLEADSCHRLRPAEERRGKGAEGHTARWHRCPGTLCGPFRVPRTAGGRRPPPLPPPRARLCNPVAAARPRAGPWGEGRGRLGWGREAATRGAACTAGRRPRFPLPGCGGRRGRPGGERASKRSLRGKEARAAAAALRRPARDEGIHFG